MSEIFADRICQLCSSDLKVFVNLRDDLIAKQKALYELAGLDDAHFLAPAKCLNESVDETEDDADMVQEDGNSQDFDIHFETIEDAPIFEDEEMEGEFISEDTATEVEEEEQQAPAVIKIEKVQEAGEETLGSEAFDFFEEIVGEEDEVEESAYEMVETDGEKDEM